MQIYFRSIIKFLLLLLIVLLLLEGLLQVTDPWGLSYFSDWRTLGQQIFTQDPARGYFIPDGDYRFSYWHASIRNGVRVTPATNPGTNCTIGMLGDSVTFGYGVDDDETWVNNLAVHFPEVTFLNTGIPGYNSRNVLNTLKAFPDADAYLYTVIYNDIEPDVFEQSQDDFEDATKLTNSPFGKNMPQTIRYLMFGQFLLEHLNQKDVVQYDSDRWENDIARFYEDVNEMEQDGRVWLAGFEGTITVSLLVEADYTIFITPSPPYPISPADAHLNPQGNIALADQMIPLLTEIVTTSCRDDES